MVRHDLVGRTFGWLKVEEREVRTSPSGNTHIVWKCSCRCGRIVYPCTNDLLVAGRRRCSVKCMGRPIMQAENAAADDEPPLPPVTTRMAIPRRGTYLAQGDMVCRVCSGRFRPTEGWSYTYKGVSYCSWACTYKARDALLIRQTREEKRRKRQV